MDSLRCQLILAPDTRLQAPLLSKPARFSFQRTQRVIIYTERPCYFSSRGAKNSCEAIQGLAKSSIRGSHNAPVYNLSICDGSLMVVDYFSPLQDWKFMCERGFFIPMDVFSSNFQSCILANGLAAVRYMYCLVVLSGCDADMVLGSSFVHMFAVCGSVQEAKQGFQRLHNRNVFSWTALIEAYVTTGENEQAIVIYHKMKTSGVDPDAHALVTILKGCYSITTIEHSEHIHADTIASGLSGNAFIGSALINMYAKCGKLKEAYVTFARLSNQNVVIWTALMAGYVDQGHGQDAFQLFQRMIQEGVEPNKVTYLCVLKACGNFAALEHGRKQHADILWKGLHHDISIGNALIDMYVKCGSLKDAIISFNKLPHQDVVAWSALIGGFAQYSDYQHALQLFEDMQWVGTKPNEVTYLNLLSACSHKCFVREGCFHFKVMRDQAGIRPTVEHCNSMVDILGKAGYLHEAEDLLHTLPFASGLAGWISLLDSCRTHNDIHLAKQCFDYVTRLEIQSGLGYALMFDIFACTNNMEEIRKLEELRIRSSWYKTPAKAFIEVDNRLHEFIIGDSSHPNMDQIHAKLMMLSSKMRGE